jgi:hypothetical protein
VDPKTCQLSVHCANNPYEDNKPLIPLHWAAGANIKYSTSDLSQQCVDAAKLDQCVASAFCNWIWLCDPPNITTEQVPPNINDPSIVRICGKTSNDLLFSRHEFGENNNDISSIIAVTHTQLSCNGVITSGALPHNYQSWIEVNYTPQYTTVNTDVYPCPTSNVACKLANAVDLCEVLTHEIGHLFGLSHTHNDYSNPMDCGTTNYKVTNIMYFENGNGQTGDCTGNAPGWTDNDQCMYRKLYCLGSTDPLHRANGDKLQVPLTIHCALGVGPSVGPVFDPGLKVFPNPSAGSIAISYKVRFAEVVTVIVYDILGRKMWAISFPDNPGIVEHSLSLPAVLGSGHYIISLESIHLRGSKSLELIGR